MDNLDGCWVSVCGGELVLCGKIGWTMGFGENVVWSWICSVGEKSMSGFNTLWVLSFNEFLFASLSLQFLMEFSLRVSLTRMRSL